MAFNRIILEGDGLNKRVLLSGGNTADSSATAFRLHGQGYAIDVKVDAEQKLRITRVVEAKRPRNIDEQRPIALVQSSVRFVDATVAGEFRGQLRLCSTNWCGLRPATWDSGKNTTRWNGTVRSGERDHSGGCTTVPCVLQPDGRWRFTLLNQTTASTERSTD